MTALLRKIRPKSSSSGKTSSCKRQKDAGGIDQIDQRQPIFHGDALGAKHLLAGHREEGAGLDGGIVGDDHDVPAGDRADAGDDAGRDGAAPFGVHVPRRPQAEFEEGEFGIDQPGDAFAGGEAVLFVLALGGLEAAALEQDLFLLKQIGHVAGSVREKTVGGS